MKSKLFTYFLIAATTVVWVILIYKVIVWGDSDLPEITIEQSATEFSPKPIAENERFKLSDIKRDPFLGTLVIKNDLKPKLAKSIIITEPVNTPIINFSGIVKNGNEKVFILTINGKQHLIRKGQTVSDIKLLSGNFKQVLVRHNNVSKTILVD